MTASTFVLVLISGLMVVGFLLHSIEAEEEREAEVQRQRKVTATFLGRGRP